MKAGAKQLMVPVILILLSALLLRVYNPAKGLRFAHDQDLYSWIAKDIVINHHQRLVGQMTSVDGVFIGSFYYYLMAVSYGIFKMNPLSAYVPMTIIGLFDIASIYWITQKHWGKKAGFVAGSIYALSFGVASYERWSVPTEPTLAWSIWFMEVILEMLKGKLKWLPLYGILVGFTWQIHIALLPILPLPIVAYFIGGNNFFKLFDQKSIKFTLLGIAAFGVAISPFLLFEYKHQFSEIKSIVFASEQPTLGPTGWQKFAKVLTASGKEFQQRLIFGWEFLNPYIVWVTMAIFTATITFRHKLKWQQGLMFLLWYGLILAAQFTSKRVVSEYYFTNLVPIAVVLVSIFLAEIPNNFIIGSLMTVYGLFNLVWLYKWGDNNESYFYRKSLVDFVKSDVVKNNYPCIGVNYIADPGVGVGFRYLFWYEGISLIKPGTPNVPVYNISIPWQLSGSEEQNHFGRFGIIEPPRPKTLISSDDCQKSEYQLDPLLGYTE